MRLIIIAIISSAGVLVSMTWPTDGFEDTQIVLKRNRNVWRQER